MRLKFNKEIEFFFKKYLLPKSFLLKKRIKRSIKNADENEIKLMLTAKRINSIDIKITITFFRFKKIPNVPKKNMIAPNDK